MVIFHSFLLADQMVYSKSPPISFPAFQDGKPGSGSVKSFSSCGKIGWKIHEEIHEEFHGELGIP
jgi:hypothetical protein